MRRSNISVSLHFSLRLCRSFCTGAESPLLSLVNNVEVTVFLVSLKAGGVALNLTEASRVYLMDSWYVFYILTASICANISRHVLSRWNPAVEFR